MMNIPTIIASVVPETRNPSAAPAASVTPRGTIVYPITPMSAVATQEMIVNPTTHGFLRCRASDIAPKIGIETRIRSEEIAVPMDIARLDAPSTSMSQTAKNSVATFIDQTVFAKSYIAQLTRSRKGARATGRISPAGVVRGGAWVTCAIARAPFGFPEGYRTGCRGWIRRMKIG